MKSWKDILSFQDKTLYASSLVDLKEFSQAFAINDSEQRLATFEEFNQGSVKTKVWLIEINASIVEKGQVCFMFENCKKSL